MAEPVLQDLVIVYTSGLTLNTTQISKLVTKNGGKVSFATNAQVTHCIAAASQLNSLKANFAKKNAKFLVDEKWLIDCDANQRRMNEEDYPVTEKAETSSSVVFSYSSDFVSEEELNKQKQLVIDEDNRKKALQERLETGKPKHKEEPRQVAKNVAPKVRCYKADDPTAPKFPADFEIVYYQTLQWTDIQSNHNKYYVLEYHRGPARQYRLYSHYGRTDDLTTNPKSGQRECRYYSTDDEAQDAFATIIKEKTQTSKGYRPVDLLFSNIGSEALKKQADALKGPVAKIEKKEIKSNLDEEIQRIVQYLYDEAQVALSNMLGPVQITANGIETPLGVITPKQIDKGEEILKDLYTHFEGGVLRENSTSVNLMNQFFTTIPHSLGGRSQASVKAAVIRNLGEYNQKVDLLQLMRDMLLVTVQSGVMAEIDMRAAALKNNLQYLAPTSSEYKDTEEFILNTQTSANPVTIRNIYRLSKETEESAFRALHKNSRLFHGSNVCNMIGLLSRGVLLPKTVLDKGGKRRDAGFLGSGIYFGDSISTSAQYCNQGSRGTSFALLCEVALGSTKQYTTHQTQLDAPPSGYHSVQGVQGTVTTPSAFKDDEFVIYSVTQQRQQYLIEFTKGASVPMSSFGFESTGPSTTSSLSTSFKKPLMPARQQQALQAQQQQASSLSQQPSQSQDDASSSESSTGGSLSLSSSNPLRKSYLNKGGSYFERARAAQESGTSFLGSATPSNAPTLSGSRENPTSSLSLSAKGRLGGYGFNLNSSSTAPSISAETSTASSFTSGSSLLASSVRPSTSFGGSFFDEISVEAVPKSYARRPSVSASEKTSVTSTNTSQSSSTVPSLSASQKTPSSLSVSRKAASLSTSQGGKSEDEKDESPPTTVSLLNTSQKFKKKLVSSRTLFGQSIDKMSQKIGAANKKIKSVEDNYRALYAKDPTHFQLNAPYLNLVSVFDHLKQFHYALETPDEAAIPKLVSKCRLSYVNQLAVVPTLDAFKENFNKFSRNVLKGLDWKNVMVAGGAVLACVMASHGLDLEKSFCDSDIDLFFYGLTEEEANKKIEDIFFTVQSNTNASGELVRTANAVTIVGQFPVRHIQIILRIYRKPAEILMGFDVDACCFGYDGKKVWASPRAQRALTKRYNLVDMSRRSYTYEARLYKYAKRGFAIAVPGLMRQHIQPSLLAKRPWQVAGLAQLILFEHALTNPQGRYDVWQPKGHRLKYYARDEYNEDRINSFEQFDLLRASDYSNVFFPYGPQWMTVQIVRELTFRDKASYYTNGNHICMIGLEAVTMGVSHWQKDRALEAEEADPEPAKEGDTKRYVQGPLAWLTQNPGTQLLTGSFHPITDDQWYDNCYNDSESLYDLYVALCSACHSGQRDTTKMLLAKNAHVDLTFPSLPSPLRHPLHVACLSGWGGPAPFTGTSASNAMATAAQCVELFFERGLYVPDLVDAESGFHTIHFLAYQALLNPMRTYLNSSSNPRDQVTKRQGWNALHIAAYYGYTDLVGLLLAKLSHEDIIRLDVHGRSPYYLALMGGHTDSVKLFFEHFEDSLDKKDFIVCPLDLTGTSAFVASCRRGHYECAQSVVTLSHRMAQGTLYLPVERTPITLLAKDANPPNKRDAKKFLQAVALGSLDGVRAFFTKRETALKQASEKDLKGEKEEADKARTRAAKITQAIGDSLPDTRTTALHIAAFADNAPVFGVLCEKMPPLLRKDVHGQGLVHYAVNNLAVSIVSYMTKTNGQFDLGEEDLYGHSPLTCLIQKFYDFGYTNNMDMTGGLPLCQEKRAMGLLFSLLTSHGQAVAPLDLTYWTTKTQPTLVPSQYKLSDRLDDDQEHVFKVPPAPVVPVPEKKVASPVRPILKPQDTKPLEKKVVSFAESVAVMRPTTTSPPQAKPTAKFDLIPQKTAPETNKRIREQPNTVFTLGSDSTLASSDGNQQPITAFFQPVQSTSFTPFELSSIIAEPADAHAVPLSALNYADDRKLAGQLRAQQLPHVPQQPPLGARQQQRVERMHAIASSFRASHSEPTTPLANLLVRIAKLEKENKITRNQKLYLKNLAVRQDPTLMSISCVFAVDKDENEFVDSLNKFCHLGSAH